MSNEQAGLTGEWIVRVRGIKSPEQALETALDIIQAMDGSGVANWEVIFCDSRWQGGDF